MQSGRCYLQVTLVYWYCLVHSWLGHKPLLICCRLFSMCTMSRMMNTDTGEYWYMLFLLSYRENHEKTKNIQWHGKCMSWTHIVAVDDSFSYRLITSHLVCGLTWCEENMSIVLFYNQDTFLLMCCIGNGMGG